MTFNGQPGTFHPQGGQAEPNQRPSASRAGGRAYPPAPDHLSPREIFPGLWYVSASHHQRPPPGLRYSRNMVVVCGADGLVLVNPVRLSSDAEAALLRHGPVRHVVRLGTYHGRDDAYYVETFGAQFWAAPGDYRHPLPASMRELSEHSPGPIPGARAVVFHQATLPEAVLFMPEHRLLLTCDSVQHYGRDPLLSPLARLVMLPMGFFRPCVIGPLWRKAVTPDHGSLRPDFERVLGLDFDNLISAHGTPKLGGAKAALARQVARLR